jgi:hypothetical protein
MGQCKSENRGFKKAKERTWDTANLRGQCKSEGKDFKRHDAKEKLRENMGRASLRKETLKKSFRRKEDY